MKHTLPSDLDDIASVECLVLHCRTQEYISNKDNLDSTNLTPKAASAMATSDAISRTGGEMPRRNYKINSKGFILEHGTQKTPRMTRHHTRRLRTPLTPSTFDA